MALTAILLRQDKEGYCDASTLAYDAPPPAAPAPAPAAGPGAGSSGGAAETPLPGMESFVCVWGTRVNALEFGGAVWGKW